MAAIAPEPPYQAARPIERLPVRRMSNEPKEAMNCKSCRKRKIKCNRLRPSCEACKVFNVECIYDAIPKKRGPKTDVLEALLKRVNGLEKRLKDDDQAEPQENAATKPTLDRKASGLDAAAGKRKQSQPESSLPKPDLNASSIPAPPPELSYPPTIHHFQHTVPVRKDPLLDLYFERLHGKPFYILDEAATRQRLNAGQLPAYILDAVHAVSARYADHLVGGHNNAVRLSEECSARARMSLNSDEPTIENLQTALLLANAFFQAGKGKRSYMLLSTAISMALALGLHRELPPTFRVPAAEREGRRKLFWTCYLMDRFSTSGSKRPSLIADESVVLRLPAWPFDQSSLYQEGGFFSSGSLHPMAGGTTGRLGQSAAASLIDITRILGITNRYLAAGGVKGDSHFPWHAQSNLSKIRHELELWSTTNQEVFLPIESLFTQAEALTIVLARLIYHLVHCLIYRPFLPVDLIELAGTEQHQPWQLEATNLCFLHANAIANLVEVGKACSVMDWPAFVGYCLCTAGTVHVHGAHYVGREGDFFARSGEYLSREMVQINEIRLHFAGIQHQKDTLQMVYGCHSQLVKSLASNPMRFSPVYQMEDFFDRYPGQYIDGAHLVLMDMPVDQYHESMSTYAALQTAPPSWPPLHSAEAIMAAQQQQLQQHQMAMPANKRRRTNDLELPIGLQRVSSNQSQQNQHLSSPTIHENLTDQDGQKAAQSSLPTPTEDIIQPTAPTNPAASGMTSTSLLPDQQTLSQNPLSPNFSFSPWPASFMNSPADMRQATAPYGLFQAPAQTQQQQQQQQQGFAQGLYGFGQHNAFTFDPGMGLSTSESAMHPHHHSAHNYHSTTAGGAAGSAGADARGYGEERTPGGLSAGSVPESDKDPFLTLLEKLAENDAAQAGGPSELDFFLRDQGAAAGEELAPELT